MSALLKRIWTEASKGEQGRKLHFFKQEHWLFCGLALGTCLYMGLFWTALHDVSVSRRGALKYSFISISSIVFEMHSALILTLGRDKFLTVCWKQKCFCGNIFYFERIFEKCVWIQTGLCVNREGRPATQGLGLRWDVGDWNAYLLPDSKMKASLEIKCSSCTLWSPWHSACLRVYFSN